MVRKICHGRGTAIHKQPSRTPHGKSEHFTKVPARHPYGVGTVAGGVWGFYDFGSFLKIVPIRYHSDSLLWDVSPLLSAETSRSQINTKKYADHGL